MSSIVLEARNLTFDYGYKPVLRSVSFAVKEGEILGIIGPNGSGKTTLARCVTKILPPKHGSVLYKGADLKNIPLSGFAKEVSFVPQELNTFFSLSVFDLVLMGRHPYIGRFKSEAKKDFDIVTKSLESTDVSFLSSRDLDEISSGEKQRVLIAKALAQEPILLFLDEPTSKLDIGHQLSIMDLLRKLNVEKTLTIICILHDLNIASDYCDNILVLDEGRVVAFGAPDSAINNKLIKDVYKTTVDIKPSSATGRPHITLRPNSAICSKADL